MGVINVNVYLPQSPPLAHALVASAPSEPNSEFVAEFKDAQAEIQRLRSLLVSIMSSGEHTLIISEGYHGLCSLLTRVCCPPLACNDSPHAQCHSLPFIIVRDALIFNWSIPLPLPFSHYPLSTASTKCLLQVTLTPPTLSPHH